MKPLDIDVYNQKIGEIIRTIENHENAIVTKSFRRIGDRCGLLGSEHNSHISMDHQWMDSMMKPFLPAHMSVEKFVKRLFKRMTKDDPLTERTFYSMKDFGEDQIVLKMFKVGWIKKTKLWSVDYCMIHMQIENKYLSLRFMRLLNENKLNSKG